MARFDETRDVSQIAPGPGATRGELPLFAVGDIVATRYQLVRFIARGGMGEVYEAEDLELGNRIAIKTIRAERVGDPEAIVRLKREVLAARRVTHANVVRLFDVGFHVFADERELAFVTMELLPGETLDAMIHRRGPLLPSEALAFARDMAAALDAAHAAGIVHRDFKSANVMVVDGRAIVTDFGLAHVHDAEHSGTTAVDFVGTPAYMAPEQVTRAQAIGPAADIYAFGVVLFEMVTGKWPFSRDTALATAAARVEEDAPSAHLYAPDLPAPWEAAIARCLRRDPARRFARASDVVAALTTRAPRGKLFAIAGGGALAAVGAGWLALHAGSDPCGGLALPDLYVDITATSSGNGTAACPLRTISEALAVTQEKRVIHVASGFYDAAHGERFPIVARGEVELVGAGADRTTISGAGPYDGRASKGTASFGPVQATIVAGDAARTIEMSQLTIASGLPHVQHDVVGVMCTRGHPGAPNTKLHDLVIGPSYGIAVFDGTESAAEPTACNLELVRTRLHDGAMGIWQVGCGAGDGRVPTGLHVSESTFEAFHGTPTNPGIAINTWDCAGSLDVDHAKIGDSDVGISIIRHEGEARTHFTIRDSLFRNLARQGVGLALSPIGELRGNAFVNVGGAGEFTGRAAAVRLRVELRDDPVVELRDNEFYGNDVGLEVGGGGPLSVDARIDLGRPDAPGGNRFRCNAAPEGSPVTGHDVAIRVTAEPGAHLSIAGNRWDHAPPTQDVNPTNGLDILAVDGSPLSIDTSGASRDTTTCPRSP